MNATPATPDATTAGRGRFERWWLVVANLLVANAASLHVGPGGLRAPSPAVNLWISALVLIAPMLRPTVLRRGFGRFRLPGKSTSEKVWVVVGLCVFGAVVGPYIALFAMGIAAITVLAVLGGLLWVSPFPSFWLWILVVVIVVLGVAALRPSPRLSRPLRIVRAVAHAPPGGLLVLVLLFTVIDSAAWVGGRDSMFDPIARVDVGAKSLVAVRSDPMAFTRPVLRILVHTPLVPGVGWWREIGSLYDVGSADLRVEGDELCVDWPATDLQRDVRPNQQRRFRFR